MSLVSEDKRKNVPAEDQILDIDLSVTRRKRFRIDGDSNRILELNLSDMGIVSRLKDAYPKLVKLSQDATEEMATVSDDESDLQESLTKTADVLDRIDKEMRSQIDYIFDSNVSELCVPSGSMYDPFNGKFRFEHILNIITSLYESNLNDEYKKMTKRVQKHTSKYIK